MKKIFKNLVLFLMLIMSTLTFAKGKLYVGTNAEVPPFEYLNNGEIAGFDIDLVKSIGKKLDMDVVISEMKDVKSKKYNASYAAIMELQNNKIDAVVLDSETALNYVKNNKGLKLAETSGEPEEYAIAISKKNSELLNKINTALDELKKDGTYEALLKKYM